MKSKAKTVSKPRRASTTTSAPAESAGPRPAKAGPPLFTEAERDQLLAVGDYLGLAGMDERAKYLGGHLEVRSAPGRATRMALQIPLPPTKN